MKIGRDVLQAMKENSYQVPCTDIHVDVDVRAFDSTGVLGTRICLKCEGLAEVLDEADIDELVGYLTKAKAFSEAFARANLEVDDDLPRMPKSVTERVVDLFDYGDLVGALEYVERIDYGDLGLLRESKDEVSGMLDRRRGDMRNLGQNMFQSLEPETYAPRLAALAETVKEHADELVKLNAWIHGGAG